MKGCFFIDIYGFCFMVWRVRYDFLVDECCCGC